MKLLGTGSYLPRTGLTNKEIAEYVDTNDEWTREKLGIHERRIAMPWETTSELAASAGLAAIVNSRLLSKDIDLIIVATSTPDK